MIQNVLTRIAGIEVYGVASLLIFAAVFAGVLAWAASRSPAWLETASRLPLEDDRTAEAVSGLPDASNTDSGHERTP
jgi:hypothetical protein